MRKGKETMNEAQWDKLLHIKTSGRDDSRADQYYYPSDEYVSYLMTVHELMFIDEIDCRDLFEGDNSREKILVFGIQ